ncbi:MAG: hypothetical protein GY743_17115 [Planctomycetaceae bacterium]|nr:hypothetical protein [Planctomycetaceae bacterium]
MRSLMVELAGRRQEIPREYERSVNADNWLGGLLTLHEIGVTPRDLVNKF